MASSYGLALGAGGVRGLAHVGVLKVLEQHQVKIQAIAGSSIGALVGALYAAYPHAETVENFFLEHCKWQIGIDLLDPSLAGGFLQGKKIEKFFTDFLAGKTFEQLEIPLTIIATDLISGHEIHITSGLVSSAIRASIAAIPLFTPVQLNELLLADGGLSNPVPDNVVKNMGAQSVIAVNLNTIAFKTEPLKTNSLPAILLRTINVLQFNLAKNTIKDANIVIEPEFDKDVVVGFDKFFDRDCIINCITKGEEATYKVLDKILS